MTKKTDQNIKLNAIVFTISITALIVVVWAKFLLPSSSGSVDGAAAETRIVETLRNTLSGSKDNVMPLNELLEQIPQQQDIPVENTSTQETNTQMLQPITSIPSQDTQPVQ
jgi:hypothetical protein